MAQDILDRPIPTPAGDLPVIPVTLMLIGAYLAWFGVRYWGSDTRYPTDPIKSLLQGNGLPTPDTSARKTALLDIQGAAQTGKGPVQGPFKGGTLTTIPNAAIPPGATTLNKNQIMTLWLANGGNIQTANLAAAHALAESSGRTWVTSTNPDTGTNVGLWQLDTKGEGAGYTIAQLQDPDTNAKITVLKTSNGTNWSSWSADPTPYL